MSGPFVIKQWEKFEGDDWWDWAVWIEAAEQDLDKVELVEWTLHPTFPTPVRKVTDRPSKFRLETGGWGVFPILARVQLNSGEEMKLKHHLKLHYPDGSETTA
jgi:transcription initiation factor IIF auxiliary subunit